VISLGAITLSEASGVATQGKSGGGGQSTLTGMPNKQNIGVIVTVILGSVGSFLGTWVSYKLGYSNQNGGFKIIPFLVGVIFAVVLIAAFLGITGRRNKSLG
jgi:uncharacterized membrane protein YeaQ/YmgE (transglycosylase-associated protein family)